MTDPAAFTLHESARRLGHLRWVELGLFELLGAAVPQLADANAKVFVAAAAPRHAWHAELLERRLPTVRDLSAERQTVPAAPALAELASDLAQPGTELDLLVAVHGVVVPHLLAAYTEHLHHCTPVADTVVERTLRIIADDLRRELADARVQMDRLGAEPGAAALAAARRSWVEERLVAAGGLVGS